MVPTPFGLLLEREIRDSERLQDDHNQLGCAAAAAPPPYPLIFTLSNPLNEIVPALVANYSGKTATLNSCPQQPPNIGYITSQQDFLLVDFIVERHFAVFYCTATGLHSIFYLRPVNGAELDWIRQDLEKPMYSASTVAEQFASQSHPHPLQTPQSSAGGGGGVPMDVDHQGPHSGPFSSNSISNIKSLNDSAGQLLSSLSHPHPPPPPTHPHHPHHHLISTPISNGELTKKRCRLSYPSGGLASSSPITRSMSSTLLGNLGSGSGGGGGSGTQSTTSAGGIQGGGRLSSPRNATAAATTGINSPLNSGSGSGRSGRHSSANALSSGASSGGLEHAERTKRGGGGGVLSPSTSKLTTLLSSRLDSPLSPSSSSFRLPSTSQHHHHYSTSTSRLMETDVDLAVGGSGSGTTQRSRSRSVTKGLLGLSGTPSPMVLNSSSTAAASATAATNTPSVERGGALYDDLLYARKYSEPIIAEFTLDYVWSETAGNSSAAAAAAPATKVFATVDLLGQNYLALLVPEGGGGGNGSSATPVVASSPSPSTTTTTVLRLIKFEVLLEEKPDDEGEDDDDCPTQPRQPRYLFGSTTRIAGVKDAQPLPSLNMLLLLDDTGSLLLYSGTERVAIVHLQPTLMMGGGGGVIPSSPVPPPLLNDSLAAMSPNFRNFFSSSSAPVAAGESPSDSSLSFSLLSTANTSRNQHHLPPTAHSSPIVPQQQQQQQQQLNSSSASVGSPSGSTLQLYGSSDNLLQQQQPKSKPNPLLPPPPPSFSIQQYPAYGRISALRDPIEGRVTLATEEGRHWRVAFPALASTFLVERCLAALRQAALPRKEAAAFLAAWYTFRNATKDEREEAVPEVALFKLCLLSMIGYDLAGARLGLGLKSGSGEDAAATTKVTKTEVIGGTHNSLAINIAVSSPQPVGHSETLEREITKKMKIEEGDQGTDEDWLEMLRNAGSLYGLSRQKLMKEATATAEQKASATIGGFSGHNPQQAASHLGKTPTTARSLKAAAATPSSPPSPSSATTSFTFTAPGPLFAYTPNILSTLHLLYEDLKLVQMNWPLCRSLVDLLYLLAVDLDLVDYQDHYCRDFADVCAETIPQPSNGGRFGAHRAKISAAIKALEVSGPPPSIFATLYGMLSPPPPKSSTVKKTSAVSETEEKSSTPPPPLSTPFPFIGNGAPSRCLSTGGAHIITPNIFNLVVLYANLHAEALVQPSAVLRCVSLPAPVHHFQQPNSTAATGSAAQTSTPTTAAASSSSPGAYINVAKYRQTVGLFGGSGQSPSNSPSTATTRWSGGNNQFAYDLSAEALQRLAISGAAAAAAAAAGTAPCSSSSTPKVTTTTPGSSTPSTPSTPSSALSSQLLTTARQRVFERREKLLFLMSAFGVTADYLKELPFGLALPLWDVIYAYRQAPKNDWPSAIYSLIDRPDLLSLEYQEHIGAAAGGGVAAAGASGGTAATAAAAAASYSGGSSTSTGANMAGDEDGHTSGGNGASTEEEAEAAAAASELAHLDHAVLRLLFPTDQRLHEAYQTMLLSSRPAVVALTQRHGVSDHDFVEEQERHLYALLIRSMAAPLGRGMVTLRSYHPVAAERFPVPPVVLTGRVPPRNTALELSHIEVPANLNVWPLFHNGVSAGLRIVGNGGGGGGSGIGSGKPSSSSSSNSSGNSKVDSSWILFNKPANSTATSEEHYAHAGFLLALGLNGLLDHLSIMDLHEYLSKGNDLTKVAILLGLAASRRGTMDSNPYILLGIHLEGLLPSTSTELDVSPIVKVAAVLGVGLLFQGTGHAYIAEVMLNEIGRPPGPEMEHYIDRESYALSAGLAFGLVTLGRGDEMIGSAASAAAAAASGSASASASGSSSSSSADGGISIPDQLNHYMLGVHKKLSTLAKEKHKTPSYHIREGDCINADVTSPGATLALGMMFFGTGNRAIAQWLEVPDTQNLLETVRPDFILLRVLAKSLILWAEVRPTTEWIESHIPAIIFNNAFQKVAESGGGGSRSGGSYGRASSGAHDNVMLPNEDYSVADSETDYETMTQSYCNIIAGACFALALRYAGSADAAAFEVVKKYTVKLISIIQKGSSAQIEQAGRSTIESCVNVLIGKWWFLSFFWDFFLTLSFQSPARSSWPAPVTWR